MGHGRLKSGPQPLSPASLSRAADAGGAPVEADGLLDEVLLLAAVPRAVDGRLRTLSHCTGEKKKLAPVLRGLLRFAVVFIAIVPQGGQPSNRKLLDGVKKCLRHS